ncbi:helicase with zinc finger domain 2-like [Mercenaria mercenaria]|uniref:helicase with zinc finger domain 2-like n=1 Tax=Mercenaria mercenaria TaxID=6596 RepID=UPI00234F90BF|nr:helicase with zinc finger domain 2-like [Mercenaria mercenaria]
MATTGTEKYSRILLTLVKGGTKVTRRFFEKRVKDLSPEQTIDEFLARHKIAILQKKPGKNKRNIYFPSTGNTDLEQWDLNMFCYILIETCDLTPTLCMYVEKLPKIRNKLCHLNEPTLEDVKFQDYKDKIKCCFKNCLKEIDDAEFKNEIKLLIKSFASGPLTLEDTLKSIHTFYHMELDQMEKLDKLDQGQTEMNEKLDRNLEKLESIESRLPQGTPVDVPGMGIVISVNSCSNDKEKEVLGVLVKHFNQIINNKESTLKEDLPNGALHTIREAVEQTFHEFLKMGRHIVKVEQKCILLVVKCTSIGSFVNLLRDYRNDALTKQLSGLETAIRSLDGCEDVELETAIDKDEFWRVMDELVSTLDEQVQPSEHTIQPYMGHCSLSSPSLNTNRTRVNGLGDIHLAEDTSQQARLNENSIRLTIKCATLSHRQKLQEYFETGVFENGMKRIQTEIGNQLKIQNMSITAQLVKDGIESEKGRSTSVEDTCLDSGEDDKGIAYKFEEAAGNVNQHPKNNVEMNELQSDLKSLCDENVSDINEHKEVKNDDLYTIGSSKVDHTYLDQVEDETSETEDTYTNERQKNNSENQEFQSDYDIQSDERMCDIDELIYSSKMSMFEGDREKARKLAIEATGRIDKEKENLLTDSESASWDEKLTDWYWDCYSILNLLSETQVATRCYYTAMVFDPEWDYDEHLHLSDMLWGKLVYLRWTSTPSEICQDVEPLLKEIDGLAHLAEERKQWSVSLAIDSDIETVYYFLNKLKRFRMIPLDTIKQPERTYAFRRMGRCYLNMGLHHDARKTCITILQDMCEYDDTEAFEIWAQSLYETGDFELALDKSALALKYCQNAVTEGKLRTFQIEIKKKIEEKRMPQTNKPDEDWLQGTHAKSTSTSGVPKIPEKQKKKHRRPKARDYSEQTQSFRGAVPLEKETKIYGHDRTRPKPIESLSERPRTSSECSITTNTTECSVSESESDNDTYTYIDEASSTSECENDGIVDSELSFYEQSLQNRTNTSPTEKLLKGGVHLGPSYLKQFDDKHPDVLDRKQFYNDLLPKADLERKVLSNPKKYVKCVIQFETSHEAYCKPVDSNKHINLIEISGRSKIGCKVFNEDEVVVEILDTHEKEEKRYGKVIGVWNRKRHKDTKHPVLLCTLDDMESHLVRPMCKTVPKIHILTKDIAKQFKTKRERAYKLEVYEYDAGKGCFCNPQTKEINPADQGSYILVVAYIHWGTRHIYPRGAVIDILPKVNSVLTGLKILNLQYEIPGLYSRTTTESVRSLIRSCGEGLELQMLQGRTNLTEMNIFTVNQADVVDLNYAFSIEDVEDGYKVGLHVSDVSAFVKKGSPLDEEASQRATTFDALFGKKRYMLPEPLSEDICSLLPNKERLTISVFLLISSNGKQMQMEGRNYEVVLSYIKSKRHLTYEEAEKLLTSQEKDDGVRGDIYKLFQVSCKMKQCRSEYASDASDFEYFDELEFTESQTESVKTQSMVEEILIAANRKITQHLLGNYRNCVPLQYIPPPSDEAIEDFHRKADVYKDIILKLQNKRIGTTVPSFNKCVGQKTNRYVSLSTNVWKSILGAPKKAAKYIQEDDLHPMQLTTFIQWLAIKNEAEYISSGTLKSTGFYKKADTRFTSPTRSFIDVIVQRLIHAKAHNRTCPYQMEDIERICIHANSMRMRERNYRKAGYLLKLATELRDSPVMIYAFVNKVSDSGVTLCSSLLKNASKQEMDLAFNLLDVAVKPKVLEDQITHWNKVKTVWKKRLYDFHIRTNMPDDRGYELELNTHKNVVFVPLQEWAKILKCSVEERVEDLSRAIKNAHVSFHNEGLDDVSTECLNSLDLKPNTTFSMTFSRGQPVEVQVSAEPDRGLLSPKLTLYRMTNNVKFCLQHLADPVRHLFRYAIRTSCDEYKNVHDYLDRWLPIMLMESSTGAVRNEENFCINNVPVSFSGRKGKFALGLPECEVRNIEFSGTLSDDEDEEENSAGMPCYDWLCLKTTVPNTSYTSVARTQSLDSVWVGHAEISKVSRKKDAQPSGKLKVSFLLHKETTNLPPSLYQSDASIKCSVEVLRKLEVDRRTESFIKMLPEIKETLAAKIALNKPMPPLDKSRKHIGRLIERDLYYDASNEDLRKKALPKNNIKQQEAIDKALESTFSLIQGPPGTGKTNTGIKLIYLFDKINDVLHKEGKQRKQVLFCGPSNKSVDLVAVWMLNRMGNLRPNFVRVYGRSIEAIDFPIPGRTFQSKRSTRNQRTAPVLYQVALHHLIRQKGKKHAEEINKMDKMFKDTKYAPMPQQVKKYVHLVREASIDEIRKHDVILCTTAVGSNPKVLSAASVYQVIVDEAGMCPEPQCLVPIIATKAEQVVLIGDHKQLRPIVMCKEAASLGLETSLFERYAMTKSSKNVRFTMLEHQYRMHPQICSFPSEQFYQNKLETRRGLWYGTNLDIWPKVGDDSYPFVLVHVEGKEEMLTVSTEDGNEQSKSNSAEVDHVIEVYSYLTKKMHQHKESIQILSQYNAQCSEIRRKLQSKGFNDEHVNTVVSSQGGEWDYVIFSTVRSLPDYKIEKNPTIGWCQHNLGFITDKNQVNVAITRARKGLIIIGNRKLLECDSVWKKLIERYERHGCIMEPNQFPPIQRSSQSDMKDRGTDSFTFIGASWKKGRPRQLRKY